MKHRLEHTLSPLVALYMALAALACVAAPLAVQVTAMAGVSQQAADDLRTASLWRLGDAPSLLAVTFGWSAAIALGATLIGVPAGCGLARIGSSRAASRWTGLAVAVLCVPPYLLYWVWGLLRLPGSPLGQWAHEAPWRAEVLQVWQLWWGLVWWTWPLIALPVAAARRAVPPEREAMLHLDGAGVWRRAAIVLREIRPSIALGGGLAWVSTLTGFAAFDLASTSLPLADTYGNVLRRIRFEVGAEATLIASWPLIAASLLLVGAVAAATRGAGLGVGETHPSQPRRWAHAALGLVLTVSLGVPIAIMFGRVGGLAPLARLGPLEGRALGESLAWALVAGGCLAALALGHALGWSSASRFARRLTTLSALGWAIMGVMPAAARGAALVAAQRHLVQTAGREIIPETLWLTLPGGGYLAWPVLVILGYLSTYGIVAVLLGWWLARGEDEASRGMRLLDGAVSVPAWLSARGGAATAAVGAAGLIGAALALGEVSTTMIVLPAGPNSLTQRLLNKMHYAYEDSAVATCLILLAIVVPSGFLASRWLGATRRPATTSAAQRSARLLIAGAAAALLAAPGCDRPPSLVDQAFEPTLIFGSTGRAPGQFIYPRGLACDERRQRIWVVDKTGRIQRFDARGRLLDAIILPEFDQGYPTGLSVEPESGRLFVADTHEHRILVYDEQGRLERIFGSEGAESGQMLYPTDVAFGPDGLVFVSEYGGNDRIQAFDSQGRALYAFGSFGFGEGEFNRPQSIEYDASRDELVIVDACNHRIVVTDSVGKWKFTVGGPGREPGRLSYPYGLAVLSDGSFIVSEFGNSRIQHLGRDGRCLGVWGVVGTGPGCLQTPWGMGALGDTLYVVDSRNDRVQALPRP